MRSLKILVSLATAATVLTLGWASSASAADFFVFGKWNQKRGSIAQVPYGFGGNIPYAASAMASQTGGGNIVFSADSFTLSPYPYAQGIALGDIIQLATTFTFNGPQAGNQTLSPGPKASRNKTFSACPGLGTGCTTVNQGPAGNGRVKYTGTATQMGGVMQMLISGVGALSRRDGTGPPSTKCPAWGAACPIAVHNPLGGGGGLPQAVGGAKGAFNKNIIAGGPIHQVTETGLCNTVRTGGFAYGKCILGSTPGTGALGPGTTNSNYGFPWTTGMVTASATIGTIGPTHHVGTGTDSRTPAGSGLITVVAGGITNRSGGSTFVSLDTIQMRLAPLSIVAGAPALAPLGVAAFTALLALAGGYSLRRRSRRD